MHAHNVYFSLHDNSDAAKQHLIAECRQYLAVHPGIVFYACGVLTPDLNRPVNDRDWDVGLHIIFQDQATHDQYQVASLHNEFVARNKDTWAKVRVFDTTVG